MALIKCPECGREVSNKAPACVHCGCPLVDVPPTDIQSKNTEKKVTIPHATRYANLKHLSKHKKWICVGVIVLVLLIVFIIIAVSKVAEINEHRKLEAQLEAEIKAYNDMLETSREAIAPYLDVIPCRPDEESGKLLLPSKLHQNIDNVEFLGLTGSISYQKDDYGVIDKVIWKSHDFFTYEEEQEFVPIIEDYFGAKAVKDHYLIGQWTSIDYYWEDDSVPSIVAFYTSVRANHEDEENRIEIYWDMDLEMPD